MQRRVVTAGVATVALVLVCAVISHRRLASKSELVSQLPGESKTAASDYERLASLPLWSPPACA